MTYKQPEGFRELDDEEFDARYRQYAESRPHHPDLDDFMEEHGYEVREGMNRYWSQRGTRSDKDLYWYFTSYIHIVIDDKLKTQTWDEILDLMRRIDGREHV